MRLKLILFALLFSESAFAGTCLAENFSGVDGGIKIQAALDRVDCSVVLINPNLSWIVNSPIKLRSNKTLKSSSSTQMAVLESGTANNKRILEANGISNVSVERLVLYGHKRTPSGLEISASSNIRFVSNVVTKQIYFGVYVHGSESSDITISWNLFSDNYGIDVRTDTMTPYIFHRRVIVRNNKMSGAGYGVALANCGPFDATWASRCEARDNLINPRAVAGVADGSGIDLNLSHFGLVDSNTISNEAVPCASTYCQCGRGITIDDVMNARITSNTVKHCKGMGIGIANGAVATHKPWWSTGNIVENNTVIGNGGFGLFSARDPKDSDDHNEYNIWRYNRLYANALNCPQERVLAAALDCDGSQNDPSVHGGFVNYAAGPVGANTFYGNIGQGSP